MARKMIVLLFVCLTLTVAADTKLSLPKIFNDGMLLQDQKELKIWGYSAPGEKIQLKFMDKTYATDSDSSGKWLVTVGPFNYGGPYEMTIADSSSKITIGNIMVGELWLCAGQSNMEMTLPQVTEGKDEVSKANDSEIRFFLVDRTASIAPQEDCSGKWAVCSPGTAGSLSAAAYYFAVSLRRELKVPVGLIVSAWGGTGIESWMSLDAIKSVPELENLHTDFLRYSALSEKSPKSLSEDDSKWMDPDFNDTDWSRIQLPLYWDYSLYPIEYDGVIWARKNIVVPQELAGVKLMLSLGGIDDYETTYFNGKEIGRTTSHTLEPRLYEVPAGLAKAGENTIAICTYKLGWGGFTGPKDKMLLEPASSPGKRIDISGEWKYKPSKLEYKNLSPRMQTSLFNAMLAPLLNLGLKGILWYQGEANANLGTAVSYRNMFPALIKDWRNKFQQGDLPFYYVQLANLKTSLGESWPLLRESQLKTLSTPNTGMAVIIDIGDPKDIHPKNKKDVGERLALWALSKDYGRKIEYSGPLLDKMTVEKDRIRIAFTNLTGGLVAKGDGRLKCFEVAGADKKFVKAEAVIDGNTVLVSSPEVKNPVAARYAWMDDPEGCNLYNGAGLPASPFQCELTATGK